MSNLSEILGDWTPPTEKIVSSPEVQAMEAIIDSGINPPDQIIMDGKLRRFNSDTKGRSKDGWYVFYGDGIPSGAFGCYKAGFKANFRADIGRKYTPQEEMSHLSRMKDAMAQRDAELERKHEIAAETVEEIWNSCIPATPDHPYLKRKGIQVHGARVTGDGRLVVPLFGEDGDLSSLQYIDADGGKLYHPGGATKAKSWQIGELKKTIYVAEGFATAATIKECTNDLVYVAYSASNIPNVVEMVRAKYGIGQDIVIVADHDQSGVGQKYADQASAKYGARVIVPPILGDANDYAQAGNDLSALLMPHDGSDIFKRLQIVFGDEISPDYRPPDELIEGLFTANGMSIVYGDSNSGKTFLVLTMAACIAMGIPFFGRQVEKGIVVYLACEAPASIMTRIQALKRYYGHSLDNLVVVPVPMNYFVSDHDAHDTIELIKEIEAVKKEKVRLMVGDTFARLISGANENSGEDVGPVMSRIDKVMTATKCPFLGIHHNGKDASKGARGWSGIRAYVDTEIEVVEKDGVRSFTVTKQRELPSKGETVYFKLHVMEMGITKFGKPATTCVALLDNQAQDAQPHKKPSKNDEALRTLERAWWASGAEIRNGAPYVSRSALRELLVQDGASQRTATNNTEASRKNGLIAPLINSKDIKPFEHGWIMSNQAQIDALMIMKNGQK